MQPIKYQRILFSYFLAAFFLCALPFSSNSQVYLPNWPAPTGYLQSSPYFTVEVKQGNGPWQDVTVLMNGSQDELIPTYPDNIYRQRSFSFAPFSFDPSGGLITVRVTDLSFTEQVADYASNVEVYNYCGNKQKAGTDAITFELTEYRYVPVIFAYDSNKRKVQPTTNLSMPNGERFFVWQHMLMIFADDMEDLSPPTADNPLIYSDATTEADLLNASTIIFPSGYHDVKNRFGLNGIKVTSNTTVWLAPDAVVSGVIRGANAAGNFAAVDDVKILGKGLLYGGEYRNDPNDLCNGPYWSFPPECLDHQNSSLPDMIELNGQNNTVRGPMIGDTFFHGVVPGIDARISNTKVWGWHYNCDGFRPGGSNSIVEHCFIRATDDALYTTHTTVKDVVFWQSFNGAVATLGWGGGSTPYNTGRFKMENCIQIYPEWRARGNNNGVLMSQLNYDQSSDTVKITNFRIFGGSPILANLKPFSGNLRNSNDTTNISNVELKNITLAGTLSSYASGAYLPNLLTSLPNNTSNPVFNNIFEFENILFEGIEQTLPPNRHYQMDDLANTALFIAPPVTANYPVSVNDDVCSNDFYLVNPANAFLHLSSSDGSNLMMSTQENKEARWVKNFDLQVGNEDPHYFYLEIPEFPSQRLKGDGNNITLTNDFGFAVQWRKVMADNTGRFFLENRLQQGRYLNNNNDTLSLVDANNAGENAKWFDDYNIRNAHYAGLRSTAESISTLNEMRVFPNPVSDQLNIEFAEHLENRRLRIVNLNGQVLKELHVKDQQIQIPFGSFPDGIYFVHLLEGQQTHVKKLIKLSE